METKQKTTLTQGSVARGMLLFALPIFISNLFQQLYNAADSLIVGNFLGGEALAAVGSSGSLIFLLTGFVNGVSLGAGVVVARYFGAKDWDRMRRTIHTTVALGLVAGVGLTVIGVILTPQILRWMGTPDDVLVNSIAYFRMYFIGSIAVIGRPGSKLQLLQSVGDGGAMRSSIAAPHRHRARSPILVGWLHGRGRGGRIRNDYLQTGGAVLAFAGHSLALRRRGPCIGAVNFVVVTKGCIIVGLPSGIRTFDKKPRLPGIVAVSINSFGAGHGGWRAASGKWSFALPARDLLCHGAARRSSAKRLKQADQTA